MSNNAESPTGVQVQRIVRPTGRCVITPTDLLHGVTAADAIVSVLRDSGFPVPWSIYDATPGVNEPKVNAYRRVRAALKECGATQLNRHETHDGYVVFEWA